VEGEGEKKFSFDERNASSKMWKPPLWRKNWIAITTFWGKGKRTAREPAARNTADPESLRRNVEQEGICCGAREGKKGENPGSAPVGRYKEGGKDDLMLKRGFLRILSEAQNILRILPKQCARSE